MNALAALRERLRIIVPAIWARIVMVWEKDHLFLLALLALDVYFARKTFGRGIWADNDSVCHYAYLVHLVEDVYPQTGSFLAYSPRFDLGVPFLLYNTPPGTYVLSGIVTTVLHVTPLMGLKITVLAGFLSVPMLGYAIAKTFEDAPRDTPKFVALIFATFSSELWGLEFFFKNGMLNPALGVPFLLATLYFFRRAQTSAFPHVLRHVAFAGFFFACTVCTHVLSAYMLALALGAFVLGRDLKDWGHDVLRLGGALGVGGALAGFWLIPSMPFAAKEDAAYTWLRRPLDTLASFLDGSLLSSYFGGFFPSFIAVSNVGIVTVVLGFFAILGGVVSRRATGPRVALIVFGLGFWIMVGPTWSFLIKYLPGYDRLLWYRFVTLAQLGWFMLAGFGAGYVANLDDRFVPYNRMLLVAGFGWAILSLGGKAAKIETAGKYTEFNADLDQIVAYLKEHGDRRGRVYDEFLGQGVIQPPSVNYPRHMTPTLSGFDEVSGWIYENNVASQVLMKKGAFWNTPFPIVDEAPRYNVKYVVAGSPHFVRALTLDPRWRKVVGQRNLVLFENVAYEPSLGEGLGLHTKGATQRYLRGGGYEYHLELEPSDLTTDEPFVIKVGYLPFFTVYADDQVVPTEPSRDGLLGVKLGDLKPKRLRAVWDVTPLKQKGNAISYAGLGLFALLVAASYAKRLASLSKLQKPLAIAGLAAGGLGVVGALIHDRNVDLSPVGFGVRGGIAPFLDPHTLKVGHYDDERITAIVHATAPAWGARRTSGREPARALENTDVPAFEIALAPGREAVVRVDAETKGAVRLEVTGPTGAVHCKVDGTMPGDITLPKSCAAPDEQDGIGGLPGLTRKLRLEHDGPLVVKALSVDSGIRLLEAESFQNDYDDGGSEAFYTFGTIEAWPSNGLLMVTEAKSERPVHLTGWPRIEKPGRFDVWLLHRTYHVRFYNTRAEVSVFLGDERIGGTRGEPKTARDFWERDTVLEWVRLGETKLTQDATLKLHIERRDGTVAGLADLDALAFVPRD